MGFNFTCVDLGVTPRNPGESCNSSLPCKEGISCIHGFCTGYNIGDNCDLNNPLCKQGLFCNASSKCMAYFLNYQSCDIDTECQTYSVCGLGKCIPKYSLPNGHLTVLFDFTGEYGYSNLCSSGWAKKNATGSMVCSIAPMSSTNNPIPCAINSICKDITHTYSNPCTCGFSGSYCPSFEGDSYLQNAILNYKILQVFNKTCYQAGLQSSCLDFDRHILLRYYYYDTNFTLYLTLPEYPNQSDCIKSTLWSNYWSEIDYINTPAAKTVNKINLNLFSESAFYNKIY